MSICLRWAALLLALGILVPSTPRGETAVAVEDWRHVLRGVLAKAEAVVIVRFEEPDRFIVVESLAGPLGEGDTLEFAHCSRVPIIGSTEAYLREAVVRAPVLDLPTRSESANELSPARRSNQLSPPRSSDRFLAAIWKLELPRWEFVRQTIGDLYLLRGEEVRARTFVSHGGPSAAAWASVNPPVRAGELKRFVLDHVRASDR